MRSDRLDQLRDEKLFGSGRAEALHNVADELRDGGYGGLLMYLKVELQKCRVQSVARTVEMRELATKKDGE